MSLTLYYCLGSTPCHAVRILAEMLGVELKLHRIKVMEGETMKEDFLKINPLHTIPTLVDGDYILWESRAIMTYLCDQYSEGETSIYPRNPRLRAQVMKWMVYDAEKTYMKVLDYVMPSWFFEQPTADSRKKMEEHFDELEKVLTKSQYLTGETLTLADITMRCSIGLLDYTKYVIEARPHLLDWIHRIDALQEVQIIRDEYLEYIGRCYDDQVEGL